MQTACKARCGGLGVTAPPSGWAPHRGIAFAGVLASSSRPEAPGLAHSSRLSQSRQLSAGTLHRPLRAPVPVDATPRRRVSYPEAHASRAEIYTTLGAYGICIAAIIIKWSEFWAFIGTLPGALWFISTCVWLALRAAYRAKELEVAQWAEDYENSMCEARAWRMETTPE